MKRKYFQLKALIVLLLTASVGFAQQMEHNDERFGKWMSFRSNTWITKNWALYAERNYRHYHVLPSIEQFAFRIGGFYRSDSSKWIFGGGYASVKYMSPADLPVEIYQTEMRLWQHVSYSSSIKKWNYELRYRAEERLLDDKDFYLRHRVRLQNTLLLNKSAMQRNAIYLQGDVELFLNTTGSLYNRTRYSASLGWMPLNDIHLLVGFYHDFNKQYSAEYFAFTFAYDVLLYKNYKR